MKMAQLAIYPWNQYTKENDQYRFKIHFSETKIVDCGLIPTLPFNLPEPPIVLERSDRIGDPLTKESFMNKDELAKHNREAYIRKVKNDLKLEGVNGTIINRVINRLMKVGM